MAQEATINARLPEALKRGGSKVLEAHGVSPTQLIRSMYAYLEREQRIPECLGLEESAADKEIARRRATARGVAGSITLPVNFDAKQARHERIEHKYGDLL